MYMKYLYFIHDWAVQVHGRDVEQHAQDADFHGLHLLVDPDNASLEYVVIILLLNFLPAIQLSFTHCVSSIVAVHGMDGHWRDSWYHQEAGVFWLRDLLPDILPQARIYSYSYDSRTSIMEIPLTLRIYEHAQSLVLHLELERESTHVWWPVEQSAATCGVRRLHLQPLIYCLRRLREGRSYSCVIA